MLYQFVQKHQGQFQMTVLLGVAGVASSAFYGWQKRPTSQRAKHKKQLVSHINALFQESKGRYGSPRIYRYLQAAGILCSQKRVARLTCSPK